MNCLRKPNRPMPTGVKTKRAGPKASPPRSTAPRRLATKPHASLLRLLDAVHRALVANSFLGIRSANMSHHDEGQRRHSAESR